MVASCPARGEVCVWHARTDDAFGDAARVTRALTWLGPAERARYDRYRFDHDRAMFLLGRVMARALVGRALAVGPMDWQWSESHRGRPEIANRATPLSFNLAHSGGTVVCVLGRDGEVGVDVEDRERPSLDPRLVRRFCSPSEIADIDAQGAAGWQDRFLSYWTLKEAYLKARGLGIAVHLADLSFTLAPQGVTVEFLDSLAGSNRDWSFDLAPLGDRLIVAVAASTASGRRPTLVIEPLPVALLP